MSKLMTVVFAACMLVPVGLMAQDSTAAAPAASQDSMKASTSTKAAHVTGKISDDGKTFVSDKDGKSWAISNPDAVKGHEGHHVALKANVDADKSSVEVVSLKMAGDDTSNTSPK
jgi:hypothetical protein